ncbi:MAG: hypothetical protein GTO45_20725 [Candidatus Aminicenantes bacterium]|nr:hypothetical protein [Candidatus Aminicenantes bacterium]NIM81212.1 hypothetical protein [Candidatus Aminicenantes bacterium]NIN20587.1 hypothetical protein [Candidatus Aminicenantes bacterium]NIN44366.1 hypothetical protein [Candidatus Aminicenantes bacterium]NIN87185.1 hypothetical protein [Candidatus Aminicenantes bacterium]
MQGNGVRTTPQYPNTPIPQYPNVPRSDAYVDTWTLLRWGAGGVGA